MNAVNEATRRGRGRRTLIAIAIATVALVGGVQWLRTRLLADLCPATVTAQGASDGVGWDVARSDCEGGRTVWQLRIVPQKGVSTLVYEAEGGPLPLGWTQTGFAGTLALASPLDGDTLATYAVPLDVKGRPLAPLRARDGHRLPAR
jgi:hypothetical protein